MSSLAPCGYYIVAAVTSTNFKQSLPCLTILYDLFL